MGNGSAFLSGSFDQYYTVKYIAGIKVITKRNKNKKEADNTPLYSHTPNTMYARRDKNGKVTQISVYKNGIKVKDIEWGHKHKTFQIGDVHVSEYKNGIREKEPREPTEEESVIANKVKEQDNG